MKSFPVIAVLLAMVVAAHGQHVKIVGIGASSCVRFIEEIGRNPRLERDYFAWAQGFMSAVVLNAPKGRDESLDLSPDALPIQQQVLFISSFCDQNRDRNYGDAVVALYLKLRKLAGEK